MRRAGTRRQAVHLPSEGLSSHGQALLPPLPAAITLLFVGMGLLGMGNGSVFQLVPQRFPQEIGVITGIVGAAGGVGGFFLPNLLGGLKVQRESQSSCMPSAQ